jgi:hypothetical protein
MKWMKFCTNLQNDEIRMIHELKEDTDMDTDMSKRRMKINS